MKFKIKCDKALNGQEAVDTMLDRLKDLVTNPCQCSRENSIYKIIFMDCNMPVKDGFEATTEIRGIAGVKADSPYITALTAYTGDGLKA